MNPLKRESASTRATDYENRIEALERRFTESEGPVGACNPLYLRVYNREPQVITPGQRKVVQFQDSVTNDPGETVFRVSDAEIWPDSGIEILAGGVYAFTYRLFCEGLPDVPFATEMNGIDQDEFLYYERTHDPSAMSGYGAHDSYVYRSNDLFGGTPPRMYVTANNPSASTTDLEIDTGAAGGPTDHAPWGTYMEIIQIVCWEVPT
jgi:hypothetical protein